MPLPCPCLFAVSLSPALCALGAVQVACVAAAGFARLAEGTRFERGGHLLCLAALAVIGCLCGVAIQLGPDSAAVCAGTLAVMTMITVADFSSET
jgi:CBS domain containing-hemolysin-like protein